MKSNWHYERLGFAHQIYDLLMKSPSSAISLFGPRRMGKTEFVTKDLGPYARKMRHTVVYASMWQMKEAPMAVLLNAFDQALRGRPISIRIADATERLRPKLKFKVPATDMEIEVDLDDLKGAPKPKHLVMLDDYCARLVDTRRPCLILLDEFQELAKTDAGGEIIAALRTSLDRRKEGLVTVFTGSSQEGLKQVFSAKDAPFYRFATQVTLPQLGDEFVSHQLGVFEKSSKRKIPKAVAKGVFKRIGYSPFFFQRWLSTMMWHTDLSEDQAIDQVLSELGNEFSFQDIWDHLNPLQRSLTAVLADSPKVIYGQKGVGKEVAKLTKANFPTDRQLQNAIRRLARFNVIEKWESQWRINDPLFQFWVKAQSRNDFIEMD